MQDPLQKRIFKLLDEVEGRKFAALPGGIYIGCSSGGVRKGNQDRAIAVSARYAEAPERDFVLSVICDGMGGMARGDEAASLALSVFVTRMLRAGRRPMAERLIAATEEANQAVFEVLRGAGGTTLSAVAAERAGSVLCVNVGDSRIYSLRGDRLAQVSKDDTLKEHLADHVRRSNNAQIKANQLLQFVGIGDYLEPHLINLSRQNVTAVLLTSDGAHDAPHETLQRILNNSEGGEDFVRKLIGLSDLMGGLDNATALYMPVGDFRPFDFPDPDLGVTYAAWSATNSIEIWLPTASSKNEAAVDRGMSEPPAIERIVTSEGAATKIARQKKDKKQSQKNKAAKKKISKLSRDEVVEDEDYGDAPLLNIRISKAE